MNYDTLRKRIEFLERALTGARVLIGQAWERQSLDSPLNLWWRMFGTDPDDAPPIRRKNETDTR